MEDLASLFELIDKFFWHGFVVFLRIAAVVSLLPAFGEQSVPVRIKVVIAICFTAIVAPAIELLPFQIELIQLFPFLFIETLIGFLIGIGVRLLIMALQTAGAIAAQSTSLSQLLGGAAIEPLAAIGYILTMAAIALAMIAGLHVKVASALIYSYEIFPLGTPITGAEASSWGVSKVSHAFQLAFILASPFIFVSILYNLTLGAINKAMPQLMVAFVGAPMITFAGVFLLFVASPLILNTWLNTLEIYLANPFKVTQ